MSSSRKIKISPIILGILALVLFAESFFTIKYFVEKDSKNVEVNLMPVKMEKDSVDLPKMQDNLKNLEKSVQKIHSFLASKNIKDFDIENLKSDSLSSAVYVSKQSQRYSQYLADLQMKLYQVPLGMPTDGYVSSNFGNRKNPIPVKVAPKPAEKSEKVAVETQIIEEKDSAGNVVKRTEVKVPQKAVAEKKLPGEKNNAPAEADQIQFHKGLDIAVAYGSDVRCTADGTVIFAGEKGGYGNCIIISHGNGLDTLYGHLSQILVAQNDRVKVGQVIAKSGNTGRSTGPHLHYEVHKDGTPVNPKLFLNF